MKRLPDDLIDIVVQSIKPTLLNEHYAPGIHGKRGYMDALMENMSTATALFPEGVLEKLSAYKPKKVSWIDFLYAQPKFFIEFGKFDPRQAPSSPRSRVRDAPPPIHLQKESPLQLQYAFLGKTDYR